LTKQAQSASQNTPVPDEKKAAVTNENSAATINGNGKTLKPDSPAETIKTPAKPVLPADAAKLSKPDNPALPVPPKGDVKTEALGMREIEGVAAEGTRLTTTVAAGAIGNERPIEIVYERWYSKDLQLIVYSRYSDPRFGEQIYRLVNIKREEPDAALFQLPADYKILNEPFKPLPAPRKKPSQT
jgi:hypothetical protein